MITRLVRWLGPWADEDARPQVRRRAVRFEAHRPLEAWVYRPADREPEGCTFVVPGLHYLGPADVRLDRFLSILAHSGQVVCCPFLPEFRRARVGPELVPDALAAFDGFAALPDLPHRRPGVFSISFGSYPAVHLAAKRDVGALTIFGGFESFEEAIRFSLEGDPGRPHDPLNRPVVFINLLEYLPGCPEPRAALAEAWLSYIRQTWGKHHMRYGGGWIELAERMSAQLDPRMRPMFEQGVGIRDGGMAVIDEALLEGRASLLHLDPAPVAPAVTGPVTIVHGRDDDVIPYTQAERLNRLFEGSALHLTGLYAHTGSSMVGPRALRDELAAMMGIVSAMTDGGLAGARRAAD